MFKIVKITKQSLENMFMKKKTNVGYVFYSAIDTTTHPSLGLLIMKHE